MPQQNTNKAIREKVNILQPSQEVINVKGKLFYHESSQSHSIIKLTKEIISNYPQLKEKQGSFNYSMFVPKSQEEMEKLIKDTNKVPILLFFERS